MENNRLHSRNLVTGVVATSEIPLPVYAGDWSTAISVKGVFVSVAFPNHLAPCDHQSKNCSKPQSEVSRRTSAQLYGSICLELSGGQSKTFVCTVSIRKNNNRFPILEPCAVSSEMCVRVGDSACVWVVEGLGISDLGNMGWLLVGVET